MLPKIVRLSVAHWAACLVTRKSSGVHTPDAGETPDLCWNHDFCTTNRGGGQSFVKQIEALLVGWQRKRANPFLGRVDRHEQSFRFTLGDASFRMAEAANLPWDSHETAVGRPFHSGPCSSLAIVFFCLGQFHSGQVPLSRGSPPFGPSLLFPGLGSPDLLRPTLLGRS